MKVTTVKVLVKNASSLARKIEGWAYGNSTCYMHYGSMQIRSRKNISHIDEDDEEMVELIDSIIDDIYRNEGSVITLEIPSDLTDLIDILKHR